MIGFIPSLYETVWFDEVDYVKLVISESPGVGDLEKEPLGEIVCAVVCLQYQVILVAVYLGDSSEVSGFGIGFRIPRYHLRDLIFCNMGFRL